MMRGLARSTPSRTDAIRLPSWQRGAASRSYSICMLRAPPCSRARPASSSIRCVPSWRTRPSISRRSLPNWGSRSPFSRARSSEEARAGAYAGLLMAVSAGAHYARVSLHTRRAFRAIWVASGSLSSTRPITSPCPTGQPQRLRHARRHARDPRKPARPRRHGNGRQRSEVAVPCSPSTRLVLDPTVREELHVDDHRRRPRSRAVSRRHCRERGKVRRSVNSRDHRSRLPHVAQAPPQSRPVHRLLQCWPVKPDRKAIEDAFRKGSCAASHLHERLRRGYRHSRYRACHLYHLPFNDIEFNQMSGRAGRDGRDATIHLLFGYGDARASTRPYSSPVLRHASPSSFSIASCASSRNGRRRRVTGDSPAPIANWPDRAMKLDRLLSCESS